jgi:hypothetical protein
MSVGSGALCWISACLTDTERTIWMTLLGKGWEILMYFMCCGFYILLKVFKWKQQKVCFSNTSNISDKFCMYDWYEMVHMGPSWS